jgi:hypothetical protein
MTNFPLPIENSTSIPMGHHYLLYVKPCPICGFLYACHNIIISSCECTYHAFCMGSHLENKGVFCANANCKQVLDIQCWMASLGFNHTNMVLKKPKLEKLDSKSTSINPDSLASKLTSFIYFILTIRQPKK